MKSELKKVTLSLLNKRIKYLFLALVFNISSFCFSADFMPKSFRAEYVERVISLVSGKMRESKGTFEYSSPGKVKFVSPVPLIIFVSNEKKSWYYRGPMVKDTKGELVVNASSDLVNVRFFDSLNVGLKNNDLYTVSLSGNKATLSFSKKAEDDLGIKSATLESAKEIEKIKGFSEIQKMTLVKSNNQSSDIFIGKFEENVQFPENYFFFETPENTNITINP